MFYNTVKVSEASEFFKPVSVEQRWACEVGTGKHQLGNAAWGASFPSERALPEGGFGIVNKADVFLKLSCFLDDPIDVGNLISGSSAFSQSS